MRLLALPLMLTVLLAAPFALAEDDVEKALSRAQELQQAGEFERATELLLGALEKHPEEARILLELGRTAHFQGNEVLKSSSPTLGRLALLDAIRWYERAARAKPDWAKAHRHLGQCALSSGDYAKAENAYRRAAELDPADGESRYQLGFALGYQRRFSEAVEAYEAAERILGPDPRILLNRGIAHASLEDVAAAEGHFVKLLRAEIEAKRPGSYHAQRGFVWLWRIHSQRRAFDRAAAAFAALASEYPAVSSAHWYLGHARMEMGKPAEAARAFAKVVELSEGFADGWRKLGGAWVGAGKHDEAVAALDKLVELDPAGESPRELLFEIVRGLSGAGKRPDALALLTRMLVSFPNDPLLLEGRADLLFREGRMEEAVADYREAAVLDPFGDELVVKAQKAVTALLRKDEAPKDGTPLRPEREEEPKPREGGAILDFERSETFVRVNGQAEGRREDGAFRLARKGAPGAQASMSILLIPTLDTRGFSDLQFEVKGPAGAALSVRAKDCYDQFEMGFVRLTHQDPVKLSGDWQTVSLGLDGFRSVLPNRPIPMNRARLRALVFEIGLEIGGEVPVASEVRLDSVTLVKEGCPTLLLADFDEEPEETLFIPGGAASAFAPTLFSPEQAEAFKPDANTYVSPAILGEEFGEGMVHGGAGSYRLTLAREGDAVGLLEFNPDRAYDKATGLYFWAKGAAGGEKVRVSIQDALDQDLANPAPASAPRLEVAGVLIDGHFVLESEWKQFRIRRSDFPDVDFRSLLRIRFHFGTPEGNEAGATWFLDDIGWD